jgi:Rod binding domain-containing protein
MDAIVHGKPPRAPGASDVLAQRATARGKVQQFEELFVQQMVGALRQSAGFGDEDGGLFGSGPGADTYAQWFDQNLAHQVSRSGHVGIADALMRDLERHHEVPPQPRPLARPLARPYARPVAHSVALPVARPVAPHAARTVALAVPRPVPTTAAPKRRGAVDVAA